MAACPEPAPTSPQVMTSEAPRLIREGSRDHGISHAAPACAPLAYGPARTSKRQPSATRQVGPEKADWAAAFWANLPGVQVRSPNGADCGSLRPAVHSPERGVSFRGRLRPRGGLQTRSNSHPRQDRPDWCASRGIGSMRRVWARAPARLPGPAESSTQSRLPQTVKRSPSVTSWSGPEKAACAAARMSVREWPGRM